MINSIFSALSVQHIEWKKIEILNVTMKVFYTITQKRFSFFCLLRNVDKTFDDWDIKLLQYWQGSMTPSLTMTFSFMIFASVY